MLMIMASQVNYIGIPCCDDDAETYNSEVRHNRQYAPLRFTDVISDRNFFSNLVQKWFYRRHSEEATCVESEIHESDVPE